ncbi:MAG: lytic transglycosylase domain-containing protein [Candidatus Sulfotelmatobacter sp.]
MKLAFIVTEIFCTFSFCWAQSSRAPARIEAEYYVTAYAQHYGVPVTFVRAIIARESNWRPCALSPKGALGVMQLMRGTADGLGLINRCNIDQNVAGGVRYLAWLMKRFRSDLRLVAAAYYAGHGVIDRRGLAYRNSDVFAYVVTIRATYLRESGTGPRIANNIMKRDVR